MTEHSDPKVSDKTMSETGIQSGDDVTSFGFRTVKASEKAGLVRQVFNNVAPKYDLMNDAMSGGLHRLWKNALVDTLNPRPGLRHVDVAGGTGDISFRILKRVQSRWPGASAEITVADINHAMLAVGRRRAIDLNFLEGLSWVCGNAECLPLPSDHYDSYTIAFGIRNVTNRAAALREAWRCLKPGGRLLCLEFSKVVLPLVDKIYDAYSFNVIPMLGQAIAGDSESYRYLVESIRRFPDQATFAREIEAAGFRHVTYRNMTGGVVALHSAWRV